MLCCSFAPRYFVLGVGGCTHHPFLSGEPCRVFLALCDVPWQGINRVASAYILENTGRTKPRHMPVFLTTYGVSHPA